MPPMPAKAPSVRKTAMARGSTPRVARKAVSTGPWGASAVKKRQPKDPVSSAVPPGWRQHRAHAPPPSSAAASSGGGGFRSAAFRR